MLSWIYDNLFGFGAFASLIGYGIGAAKWAAALHTEVRLLREDVGFLREFRQVTDRDSDKQWNRFDDHTGKLANHGERITRVESRVEFHDTEIAQLKEAFE